jgi:hypothetical protein
MNRPRIIEFIKKNRKYFRTSSKILELLYQAKNGGFIASTLAGFSATGEIVDALYPDPDPSSALLLEGLSYSSTSIRNFICDLLMESWEMSMISASMTSQAFVWRFEGVAKIGILVHSGGYAELYLSMDGMNFLHSLIRSIVWSRSSELELNRSKKGYREIPTIAIMGELGPYIGNVGPEWYVNRIKKYKPGPRTILFKGPTGIGKGVLARHISRSLKKNSFTLKISSESLTNCDADEIIDIVKILQPTVLLLDDLELQNSENTSVFLAFFETLRDSNCLVIVTMMSSNEEAEKL